MTAVQRRRRFIRADPNHQWHQPLTARVPGPQFEFTVLIFIIVANHDTPIVQLRFKSATSSLTGSVPDPTGSVCDGR